MECANHLRQIGLAIARYESVHKAFPPGSSYGQSFLMTLLPFLEQQALFDELERTKVAGTAYTSKTLAAYVCPSDGSRVLVGSGNYATTNYAGSAGVWAVSHGFNGAFSLLPATHGFRSGPIRAGDFKNGLSQTAAVSESLRANGSWDRLRVNWNTPKKFASPTELDAFVNHCNALLPHPREVGWRGDAFARGMPWTQGGVGYTLYNHASPPNSPSCYNGTDVLTAISSAASSHRHGVNVLHADEHMIFVASSIDLEVWRQRGSRVEAD